MAIRIIDILIAALLTSLSAVIITAILQVLGPDWSAYAPASCLATHCFCEMPRDGSLVLQPSNSWSSLGFTFVGFLIILNARMRGWTSAFPPAAAQVFGWAAIFVGLGSVLLHATLTLWGQFFDVVGMYFISAFMVVAALAKWRQLPNRTAILLYVILSAGLIALLIALPDVRRWLFAVVLVTAIILELGFARPLRLAVKTRLYIYGMATNAVAFTIWNLDQNGQLCAPGSLLQGHAIWHLLGALALWFAFLYYRSERATKP